MYHLPGFVVVLVRPLRRSLGYHGRCTYSPVLVPRAGTSFVQCFAWSAKRGKMCLVCPTPCTVRLGIMGVEHTRPCWYLCWYLFQRGQMCLVCPTPAQFAWVSRALNIPTRVGTCAGTSFVQFFAWSARAMYHLPRLVLVLVPLVQCFARSARAMYLLARVHACVVCESLHSVYCACIPCTVLRLVHTGNVPTCPCSHLYWYLLCSWTARAFYLLARVRIVHTCSCL